MPDHTRYLASRPFLYFSSERTLLLFELIKPDLDQFVVFQSVRNRTDEHIGHALLANNDIRIEVVAEFAQILTLGTGEFNHGAFVLSPGGARYCGKQYSPHGVGDDRAGKVLLYLIADIRIILYGEDTTRSAP